jgi:hypothetical protein
VDLRRRGRHGDRAATLVEIGLVAPVFFALAFGVVEMGFLFRDYQISSDAVTDASRTGALMGPQTAEDGTSPDFHIIRALREATGSMPVEWVQRIVVFRAPGPPSGLSAEDQTPDDCRDGIAVAGTCNVYDDPIAAFRAVEEADAEYFACPDSDVACDWPAASRRNGPTVDAVDHIGVWIRVQRPSLTGIFGSSVTFEQASVVRIEVGALTG